MLKLESLHISTGTLIESQFLLNTLFRILSTS